MKVHEKAAVGFERAADAYERGRPEYPGEAVRFIHEQLVKLQSGYPLRIADVAAGTGKFTKVLFETGSSVIGEIIAVEPVAAMRAKCAARFQLAPSSSSGAAGAKPHVQVIPGVVEHLPFDDESLDVITVAQAFHWFDG